MKKPAKVTYQSFLMTDGLWNSKPQRCAFTVHLNGKTKHVFMQFCFYGKCKSGIHLYCQLIKTVPFSQSRGKAPNRAKSFLNKLIAIRIKFIIKFVTDYFRIACNCIAKSDYGLIVDDAWCQSVTFGFCLSSISRCRCKINCYGCYCSITITFFLKPMCNPDAFYNFCLL